MHFALPQRKISRPPPYVASRPVASTKRRRRRLQIVTWSLLAILFFIILLSQFKSGRSRGDDRQKIPPDTPHTVLVTVFDANVTQSYRDIVEDNRKRYAQKQGYGVFFANITDYDLRFTATSKGSNNATTDAPTSWAKIPSVRHAMAQNPYSTLFFFLDQKTFIVNPQLSLEQHIMDNSQLEKIMVPNQPVVPPNSVIKTANARDATNVDVVMTQDQEGLRQETFIIRQGEWAKFFLDAWFDPLYRSYNFQRAEGHALEHLVQWHATILARLAIVPQRTMNSYYVGAPDEIYQDGDFVVNLLRCDQSPDRSCEDEAKIVIQQFNVRLRETQEV